MSKRIGDRRDAELDIIIVNWNSGRQLRDCLESIYAADKNDFELRQVVIVDNGSRDCSADNLEDLVLPLEIIRNETNRGFAAACNQGVKNSRADYLLFLNPDTRLNQDSLSKSLSYLEAKENKDVGILGIQLFDENGKISRSCARFPSPLGICIKALGLDHVFQGRIPGHFMTEWDHKDSRIVDQVMGAFFLVRHSVFEALSGFDEQFFVYFEEVDFSRRALERGWRSYFLAEAQAFHKGGGTSGQIKATRLFYSLRSRIQYAYKHFGWFSATALALGTLLVEPFPRLIQAALTLSWTQAENTMMAYTMLWREVPSLLVGSISAKDMRVEK